MGCPRLQVLTHPAPDAFGRDSITLCSPVSLIRKKFLFEETSKPHASITRDFSRRLPQLVPTLEVQLADARSRAARLLQKLSVFSKKWDDPLISAIGWMSELVEITGCNAIFADRTGKGAAIDRVVTTERWSPRGQLRRFLALSRLFPTAGSQ